LPPDPHPPATAINATANSPLNHFIGFMAFFPFVLEYPGGAPRAHRPLLFLTQPVGISRYL
jgi:hypothetical protein